MLQFILFAAFVLEVPAQDISVRSVLADSSKKVLVAAHRGDWKNYPENSIPAIQSCIDKGIDIVEIDVQRTSDGKYVLMHDQTVNRTTNGKGKVNKLKSATVCNLNLKDKSGKLTNYKVPALDTVLQMTKGKIIVNIDKSSGRFNELLPIIQQYKADDHVILKGKMSAGYFHDLQTNVRSAVTFMPIIDGTYTHIDSFLTITGSPLIEVLMRNDTCVMSQAETLKRIKSRNCGIWYNALFASISGGHVENEDAVASWDWFLRHDSKIIQTDYPFELMQYLVDRGFRSAPPGFPAIGLDRLPIKKRSQGLLSPDSSFQSYSDTVDREQQIIQIPITNPSGVKKKIPDGKVHEAGRYITVRKNDTLGHLARRHRMSLASLLKLNPKLSKNSLLQIGMKIRVR